MGKLSLNYYSGADEGCFPVWDERLRMQGYVLMGDRGFRCMQEYDIYNVDKRKPSFSTHDDDRPRDIVNLLRERAEALEGRVAAEGESDGSSDW